MKVLILSTCDLKGGAARAAYRLHQGLLSQGVNSQMLVQNKMTSDRTVFAPQSKLQRGFADTRPTIDTFPLVLYPKRERTFYSTQWLPDKLLAKINQINPDIINLHWIAGGFLQIETIAQLNKPIVWTFHDMWAFTGGCHYNGECDRYRAKCGSCPQLNSKVNWDLSRWIWHRKAKAWQNKQVTVVTPSKWLGECAKNSSLFQQQKIEVIPNGINIERYQPLDKKLARKILGLPQDKHLILFGAVSATSDRRKGFHLLLPALQKLSNLVNKEQLELIIFGASQPENSDNFGLTTRYLDKLYDEISISLLYAAADVFVCPSLQENLPNTILEALACGTPCVAFNIGGIPDMINHKINGYLAKNLDVEDFAQGIAWILSDVILYDFLSEQARKSVQENFTLEIQAAKYNRVFREIIGH